MDEENLANSGVDMNAGDIIVFHSTTYAYPPAKREESINLPFDFDEPKNL